MEEDEEEDEEGEEEEDEKDDADETDKQDQREPEPRGWARLRKTSKKIRGKAPYLFEGFTTGSRPVGTASQRTQS